MKSIEILFLALVLLFISCNSNNQVLSTLSGDNGINYNESHDMWVEMKNENGNSYKYQSSFQSWVGFGDITEVDVEEGVVIARNYTAFIFNDLTNMRETTTTYNEVSNQIGANQEGAPPLTIDELYQSCSGEFLKVNRSNNTLYFESNDSGLMKTCGYVCLLYTSPSPRD